MDRRKLSTGLMYSSVIFFMKNLQKRKVRLQKQLPHYAWYRRQAISIRMHFLVSDGLPLKHVNGQTVYLPVRKFLMLRPIQLSKLKEHCFRHMLTWFRKTMQRQHHCSKTSQSNLISIRPTKRLNSTARSRNTMMSACGTTIFHDLHTDLVQPVNHHL